MAEVLVHRPLHHSAAMHERSTGELGWRLLAYMYCRQLVQVHSIKQIIGRQYVDPVVARSKAHWAFQVKNDSDGNCRILGAMCCIHPEILFRPSCSGRQTACSTQICSNMQPVAMSGHICGSKGLMAVSLSQ